MLHTVQGLAADVLEGVTAHLHQWEGWSALIAAALYGYRRAALWLPLAIGLIINPMPYAMVTGLVHGPHVNLNTAAVFTLDQWIVAYLGFLIGRLVVRFR